MASAGCLTHGQFCAPIDNQDPEARIAELERQVAEQKRIAELERQLAEAKAAAGQYQDADQPPRSLTVEADNSAHDSARRYAESLLDGLRTGQPSPSGGPSGADLAQLRDGLARAAAQAGMSQEQSAFGGRDGFGHLKPKRTWTLPNQIGVVVGVVGGCVGGGAALTATFPSTALWTSTVVCGGPNS